MPLMIRLNRVIQVPDGEVEQYRTNGYKFYETTVTPNTEPEQGETLAPAVSEESTDYNDMDDEALAALAAERQIDVDGKTRRQVINALRKADE